MERTIFTFHAADSVPANDCFLLSVSQQFVFFSWSIETPSCLLSSSQVFPRLVSVNSLVILSDRRFPSPGRSWAGCCRGRWFSFRDQCRRRLTGENSRHKVIEYETSHTCWSTCVYTWQVTLLNVQKPSKDPNQSVGLSRSSLLTLGIVLQVPDRFHVWQQREAEGRRGVPLQPEVQEVAVYRLQHATEGALGPRGDPVPDALRSGGHVRNHLPSPERQI